MYRKTFTLDRDALIPIIDLLQDALLHRPEMDEHDPYDDVDEALENASPFFEGFQDLIAMQDEGLDEQVMMKTAMAMTEGYQAYWERPFPPGLEAGQPLFSAVMEKPMRDLIRFLKAIASGSEKTVANDLFSPQLVLDPEEEMIRFQDWREEQEEKRSASGGFGLGSLVLAFGLGWLFRGDGK